jgi:hypothetical protein
MNRSGRKATLATLGLLSLLVGVGGVVAPVFAWHIVSFTTTSSTTSAAIGTGIYDTAYLQISNNGGPYGSITYHVYQGSCNSQGNPTGSLVYTSPAVSVTAAASTGTSPVAYTSATVSTTTWSAGSYVWVVNYSGTGSSGYPAAKAACEPFSLFQGPPPPPGVPQFPLGLAALMAIAVPALLLVKSKRSAIAA